VALCLERQLIGGFFFRTGEQALKSSRPFRFINFEASAQKRLTNLCETTPFRKSDSLELRLQPTWHTKR
jgi:hypothetical protein